MLCSLCREYMPHEHCRANEAPTKHTEGLPTDNPIWNTANI